MRVLFEEASESLFGILTTMVHERNNELKKEIKE